MFTGYSTRDGMVTDRLLRFYEEKAKGGMGLIIVEYSYIDLKASMSSPCQLGAYDDTCIIGLAQLAEVMQQNGAKACLQIVHCGRQRAIGTYPMVAPSRVPWEELAALKGVIPTELSIEEIREIVEAFGDAARRAKQAGFDMVEIHGGHGYLITNFLSPHTNKRTDMYGGNLRERMRFGLEVTENVRRKVGPSFPVGIRLSGTEYMEDGVMIEDTVAFAKELENKGIDVFHISGGNRHTIHCEIVPSYQPVAFNVWAAEAVKKEVHIPVIASGSITSPALAESILEDGKADFVGLGRPLLADPYFPKKAEEGRADEIRPCIRCNQGCLHQGTMSRKGLMCSVNIAVGRENRFARLQYEERDPALKSKTVLVVGGGPGGMEAARVAALRGHKVTLFERRDRLGGALLEASVPEFKSDLRPLIDYLSHQLKKLGVAVNLNKEINAREVMKEAPDAVIVATGSKPSLPQISGIEKPNVVNGLDILGGKVVGKRIIIIGGGLLGSELALFLRQKGKEVVLTTRQRQIGYDMEITHFTVLMDKLREVGVQIYTQRLLQQITDNGVIMVDLVELEQIEIKGDHVAIMGGFLPDMRLYEELKNKGWAVYPVGDCIQPRSIQEAIYEGHLAGRSI